MIEPEITDVIEAIVVAEGGFVDHPDDKGGPTKYGITLATLRCEPGYAHAEAIDVRALSLSHAKEIYRKRYSAPYEKLTNGVIYKFVVNAAVQHGTEAANKILQRAVGVRDDGVLGPVSWSTIFVQEEFDPLRLLRKLVAERCKYYAEILQHRASQRVFAAGWFNRVAKDLS